MKLTDFLVANWAQVGLLIFSVGVVWQKMNQIEKLLTEHRSESQKSLKELTSNVHRIELENASIKARFHRDERDSAH